MNRVVRLVAIAALVVASISFVVPRAPSQVAAAGSITITSPAAGAVITGPIRISGSYTNAYGVQISFNAGPSFDVHLEDLDGNESGTWYYDWTPSGVYGNVEIMVHGSNVDDRYWSWAPYRNVTVSIPAQQPPTIAFVSPAEGATASGVTPISVAASDNQGISSVQVRVDWGAWQSATPSGGNYVYQWDATGLGNKTHAVEARVTDTHGNVTKSATRYIKTGLGTSEPPAVKQSGRAMWVWDVMQLLQSAGSRDILGQFMDDPTLSPQLRKTIYFYADQTDGGWPLVDNPALYRNFISWAHGRGYYVHALFASGAYLPPAYAYSRYHDRAGTLVESVLNYNISSAPAEQFDGINVDIEPYVMGDWISAAPSLQIQYLDMLDLFMQRKAAAGQNINIGPAVPRWYDVATECLSITWKGATKTCAQHIQDTVDYITIMDYRDQADAGGGQGIIPDAQNEINYANTLGKKVMLGVETSSLSSTGDPESITFQEEGRTGMESQLSLVYSHYAASPSFLGVAVHYYDSYRALPTVWSATGTRWQPVLSDVTAPTTPLSLAASAWDWQRVDLSWSRSSDDVQVEYYELHRSTTSGFTPSSATLAATAGGPGTSDRGLLASTTYYYKVIAVDISGKKSAASSQISVTTPAGVGALPMKIASITMSCNASNISAKIKVTNLSGTVLGTIKVVGHWEGATGRKFSGWTAASGASKGIYQATSETVAKPVRAIVVPERLMGNGYYWASSQDAVHSAQIDCN